MNIFSIIVSCQNPTSGSPHLSWTPEDEGDHFPCRCEWWMLHISLKLDNGQYWDASATFQYRMKNNENATNAKEGILLLYFFDRISKTCYDFSKYDRGKDFSYTKNMVDLRYHNCTLKGLYPNYSVHLQNSEKTIILDIKLNATSLPHWTAEECGGNGYFPWGFGICRYGFITRLSASGLITIDNKSFNASGVGYFEHAWGNFSYISRKPFIYTKDFIKDFSKVIPLIRWYHGEQSIHDKNRLVFSSDNIFGYDWCWAAFDNGWSLTFAIFHMLDCIAEGPAPAILAATPDGHTYWDFADITVKYGESSYYIPESDTYLPLDIGITAYKQNKKLVLWFNATTEPHDRSIWIYPAKTLHCGTAGIHAAGNVEGYFKDQDTIIPLKGICAIGPFRNVYSTKSNKLQIEFIPPNDGLGIKVHRISHRFGFELYWRRQWLPIPERELYIKPCNNVPSCFRFLEEKDEGHPRIWYVGGTGPGNFTIIQNAVDNASNGDTVFVHNGTYNENVIINKSINLIGQDKEKVILNARSNDGIKITANNIELTGFTINISHADQYIDSAIDCTSSLYCCIHDNNIINSEWYGIFLLNSSYNIIRDNTIYDNDIGIWLCRSQNNLIYHNNISECPWYGIWLWPFSKNNYIIANNFFNNTGHCKNTDLFYRNSWYKNYWDDYWGIQFPNIVDLNHDGYSIFPYKTSLFERDWQPRLYRYKF